MWAARLFRLTSAAAIFGATYGVRLFLTRISSRCGSPVFVGGSYAYPECGLSQISLEWMLCEAVSFGLIVDAKKAEHALGRIPPSPPVAPDPRGILHNSLTFWWWLIEFLPHSYFDSATKKVKWRIPLGARRFIPQDSVLHSTVQQKLQTDPSYKPPNLPGQFGTEPRNPCVLRKSASTS